MLAYAGAMVLAPAARLAVALSLLACSLPLVGCKALSRRRGAARDDGAELSLSEPPRPEWKDDQVKLAGTDAEGLFHISGARLSISFHDLPAGTVLSAAGQKARESGGSAQLSVDLSERIAKLSPRDAFDRAYKFDPQVKAELDFGKGVKLELDAPSDSLSYSLGEMYKKVADAPVVLAKGEAPREHTILFLGGLDPEPMGTASTLAEIDWVALETNQAPRSGRTCDGYRKSGKDGDGPAKSLVLQLVDQKVTIYEARTSKEIASKVFVAEDRCPMMAFSGEANSYASTDEQKTWLRAQRTKPK